MQFGMRAGQPSPCEALRVGSGRAVLLGHLRSAQRSTAWSYTLMPCARASVQGGIATSQAEAEVQGFHHARLAATESQPASAPLHVAVRCACPCDQCAEPLERLTCAVLASLCSPQRAYTGAAPGRPCTTRSCMLWQP